MKLTIFAATGGIGRHLLGSQLFDYWFDPCSNRQSPRATTSPPSPATPGHCRASSGRCTSSPPT